MKYLNCCALFDFSLAGGPSNPISRGSGAILCTRVAQGQPIAVKILPKDPLDRPNRKAFCHTTAATVLENLPRNHLCGTVEPAYRTDLLILTDGVRNV